VGKTLGKLLLEKPRKRCKDNINMDLREIACEDWKWMELV
jgi:hypothetical protein